MQNKKIHYAMDLRHHKLLKEVQTTDSERKKLKPRTKEKKRKTTETKLIDDGLVVRCDNRGAGINEEDNDGTRP